MGKLGIFSLLWGFAGGRDKAMPCLYRNNMNPPMGYLKWVEKIERRKQPPESPFIKGDLVATLRNNLNNLYVRYVLKMFIHGKNLVSIFFCTAGDYDV